MQCSFPSCTLLVENNVKFELSQNNTRIGGSRLDNKKDWAPFLFAVEKRDVEIVQYLVENFLSTMDVLLAKAYLVSSLLLIVVVHDQYFAVVNEHLISVNIQCIKSALWMQHYSY